MPNTQSYKMAFLATALGALIFGALICNRAAPAQVATEPIWPTKKWQTSSPEEQGMDSKELAELVDFGARRVLATPSVTLSACSTVCWFGGLYLEPRDMAKLGYLYLRKGVWEGQELLPSAWIDKVSHAAIDMHLTPGLRYSNLFWALPDSTEKPTEVGATPGNGG
jgi:CubicO group peptidase (beta-lactamase class C family)